MEGSWYSYIYDWHPDGTPMVHLRFGQGHLPFATSAAARNAGESEEKVGSSKSIFLTLIILIDFGMFVA